ncbi:sugar phosphate isomerase/epimerase family protein [Paenibacillus senegalensis]|uniref:sugar phosphate isomerase/epimerase family protein n=1 Tax=Paenibacillus senegalensis TaxID=1465766 RepID=UPI0002881837|nr:sugar phosphate isomerase/epimerase family protein [Paenibacillus senegalensis]
MSIYINLLPYMKDEAQLNAFLEQWQGGVEWVTEGVQWANHPSEWSQEIPALAKHTGPISVHTPIFDLNLASPRYRTLSQYSYEVYQQALLWSAKIGAKHAVIHPNLQSTPIYDREGAQACSKHYLRQLGQLGERLGVKVMVENVGFHDCALFNPDEFVELFDEIPEIDALLDIGHAHINNWDIPRLIERLDSRLTAIHLHDNHGAYDEHLPMGDGTVQWEPIWEKLERLEQEPAYILEYQIGTRTDIVLAHAAQLEQKLRKTGNR